MTITEIFSETRDLVDADSTSYPDTTLLRRVNSAYEDVVGMLLGVDGQWQYGDSNWTDHPIATTTLVASQNDYAFSDTHLIIEQVKVKDIEGHWSILKPIDKMNYSEPLSEIFNVDGLPEYYDKNEGSIWLYPAPSATYTTLTSGLEVCFQRTADVFSTAQLAAGTKKPGFASPFHPILSYKAALPYALSYKKDRVPLILNEITRIEKDMKNFYAKREKDVRSRITMKGISFR